MAKKIIDITTFWNTTQDNLIQEAWDILREKNKKATKKMLCDALNDYRTQLYLNAKKPKPDNELFRESKMSKLCTCAQRLSAEEYFVLSSYVNRYRQTKAFIDMYRERKEKLIRLQEEMKQVVIDPIPADEENDVLEDTYKSLIAETQDLIELQKHADNFFNIFYDFKKELIKLIRNYEDRKVKIPELCESMDNYITEALVSLSPSQIPGYLDSVVEYLETESTSRQEKNNKDQILYSLSMESLLNLIKIRHFGREDTVDYYK